LIVPTNDPVAGEPAEVRASHADREQVVDVLRVAAGDGRLTTDELDERLEAALSARTVGKLDELTADLGTRPGIVVDTDALRVRYTDIQISPSSDASLILGVQLTGRMRYGRIETRGAVTGG
jgi:uncharacterized protein DUF1707